MLKGILKRLNQLQEEMDNIKNDLVETIQESFDIETLDLKEFLEEDDNEDKEKDDSKYNDDGTLKEDDGDEEGEEPEGADARELDNPDDSEDDTEDDTSEGEAEVSDDESDESNDVTISFEKLEVGEKFTFGSESGVDGEFEKVSPTEYTNEEGKKFAVINPEQDVAKVSEPEVSEPEVDEPEGGESEDGGDEDLGGDDLELDIGDGEGEDNEESPEAEDETADETDDEEKIEEAGLAGSLTMARRRERELEQDRSRLGREKKKSGKQSKAIGRTGLGNPASERLSTMSAGDKEDMEESKGLDNIINKMINEAIGEEKKPEKKPARKRTRKSNK